jgi:3-hydroxyisobutyrate dehydrogenase
MARPSKTNVGVIGLGIIGSRVAANLRAKGFQTWVWNRSPRPEPNFLPSPIEVAESAKIIQIFVSDGPALIETVTAMSASIGPGHVIINHATVSPTEVKEAARLVQDRHGKFLDAPFTGSRDAAQAGELVFLIGGDAEVLSLARPVLEANAKSIIPVGAIGDATALKIATNLIAAVSVTAYSEALALLAKSGVPMQNVLEVMPHHAIRSQLAEMKIPGMILDDFEPRFALKHMFKDVQIALTMANEAGIEIPAAGAFAGSAMAGIQQGLADSDFSSIARLYHFPDREAPLDEKFRPAAKKSTDPSEEKPQPKRWPVFGSKK